MEGTIGEIRMFAGTFAPKYWAFCAGQLMPIAQNTALFSILGTTYGGNGQTTFALPDLRGRVPAGTGQGLGLTEMVLGQLGGEQAVTLITNQLPAHNHLMAADSADGTLTSPTGNLMAVVSDANLNQYNGYATTANTTLSPTAIGITGNSLPHDNMQPYLGINYVICLNGIFPSRN